MRRCSITLAIAVLSLAGCQSNKVDPDTVYLEAAQLPEAPAPQVKEVHVPVPTPQLRRLPVASPSNDEDISPERAITDAKADATQRAHPDDFIQATQVYDYLPGVVYEVIASPGHVTTIALESGEKLITKAAGDTSQWFVGDAPAPAPGNSDEPGTLLLVKPLKPNVETNLVVSTDRRLYQIDLKSLPGTYHSEVRWNYPADLARQLMAHHHEQAEADEDVLDAGVNLANLDFGYRVRAKNKEPDWTPQRVFTDGRKTYIGFPDNLAVMEAPPLFVLSRKDEVQLVNYRVRGHYYIVDRVIDRAELRLGEAPQQVVTIERINVDRHRSNTRRSSRTPSRRR